MILLLRMGAILFLLLFRTWHVHRAVLLQCVPNAQLAVLVPAPTLDSVPAHNGARVVTPQSDGRRRHTCKAEDITEGRRARGGQMEQTAISGETLKARQRAGWNGRMLEKQQESWLQIYARCVRVRARACVRVRCRAGACACVCVRACI